MSRCQFYNQQYAHSDFPSYCEFEGNMTDQYKQIGNAVPVNLAYAIGRSLIRLFNDIDAENPEDTHFEECQDILHRQEVPFNGEAQ